jgi:hypothetical protein
MFWIVDVSELKKITTHNSDSRISYPDNSDGFDHINRNAPVLIRTPKLTRFEPAQYWGGGPPGNSVVLNPFFLFRLSFWQDFTQRIAEIKLGRIKLNE